MPAKSSSQRRMACADLNRANKGQRTRTGMSKKQLEDFCKTPGKLPKRTKK